MTQLIILLELMITSNFFFGPSMQLSACHLVTKITFMMNNRLQTSLKSDKIADQIVQSIYFKIYCTLANGVHDSYNFREESAPK